MKKAILLLHGFKRNDIDDFEEVQDYIKTVADRIGAEKVYNEIWFENYEKETLNLKHFDKRVKEISTKINNENYDEVVIISFSSGTIVAANVKELLTAKSVKYYGVTPTIKPHILKWIKTLTRLTKANKKLKKKLGKERYDRLKQVKTENQVSEKYPVKIILYMFKGVIGKRKKALVKIKDANFLVASDDHIVKTKVAIKKLSRNGTNNIVSKDFTHDYILRRERQIFIEWLDSELK